MVMLSKLEGHTSIYHIFTAAERAAYGEHGIFIGPVEGIYSYCMGIFIITVTCCKIPFIIRVKILRMKSGQSSCSCTNPVHPVIQFRKAVPYGIHTMIQVSNVICIILHLTVQNRKILPGCIPCLHIGTIIRYTGLIIYGSTCYNSPLPFVICPPVFTLIL